MRISSPKTPLAARTIFGALVGTVPLWFSSLLSPNHRSPYLFAYPVVIFSAWVWGLPASISCACVAGYFIEHFMFATGRVNLAPAATAWIFRESTFLVGSIMVGALTQSAAKQRQQRVTAELEQQLRLTKAQADTAMGNERAAQLDMENEVRSKLLLDGALVGLWEWEASTDQCKWSSGFYRLHWMDPSAAAPSQKWRSSVYPEDVERVDTAIRTAISDGGTFHEEYRISPSSGGAVRWNVCQGFAVPGENGKAAKLTGFVGDITRRKQADIALMKSEKLAIAVRLSAAAAHEIRDPLDAVVNIVYLLRQESADQQTQEFLDEAAVQLERVSQIARQTLRMSRSSAEPVACSPSSVIAEVLRLLAPNSGWLRLMSLRTTEMNQCFHAFAWSCNRY